MPPYRELQFVVGGKPRHSLPPGEGELQRFLWLTIVGGTAKTRFLANLIHNLALENGTECLGLTFLQ